MFFDSAFNNGGMGAAPVWSQWLKASKHPTYDITQINSIPTITSGVQVITTLIYAWTSDGVLKGNRLPPIIFGGVSHYMHQQLRRVR